MSVVKLMSDNQTAIKVIKRRSAGESGGSKHIDVLYHFLRDRYQRGEIAPEYVDTASQLADMFTKQIPGPAFSAMVRKVCGQTM